MPGIQGSISVCRGGEGVEGKAQWPSEKNEVSSKTSEDWPLALHSSYKWDLTLTHKKMQGQGRGVDIKFRSQMGQAGS